MDCHNGTIGPRPLSRWYLILEIFKDLVKFFVIFLKINYSFTKLRN